MIHMEQRARAADHFCCYICFCHSCRLVRPLSVGTFFVF